MPLWTALRRKLQTAATFSRGDWIVFLQAWLLLPLAAAAVRTRRGRRLLEDPGPDTPPHPEPAPSDLSVEPVLRRVRQLTDAAVRCHLIPFRCLPRALVLRHLLRRRGIATVLRIGVRKEVGNLAAHCWLEMDGCPIAEHGSPGDRFLPLTCAEPQSEAGEKSAGCILHPS